MRTTQLTPLFLALAAAPAAAESLILTPHTTLDLSALGLDSVGDLAFENSSSRLWLCDGSSGGDVYEVSPVTGALLSSFDPGSIPGLNVGPEALAIGNGFFNPHLFVFSSVGESEGGAVTQGGTLVADYGTSHAATGADVDAAGNLWLACGITVGGGVTLRRIDTSTGAVLQTVVMQGNTLRAADLTFDPVTGRCYVLLEDARLIEVNLSTGAQVSTTDMSGFSPETGFGSLDFSRTGEFLYYNRGVTPAVESTIFVLKRDFDRLVCDGAGFGIPCPCANAGLPGRGCENSFATGGALLDSTGVPAVAADTFALHVVGLPPGTSCLFFQGTTEFESTPQLFGDGHRCVTGAVIRLGTKTAVAGAASYPTGSDLDVSVRGAIPAGGATRYYQTWYRNVASFCTPAGFNLSNASKVIWQP